MNHSSRQPMPPSAARITMLEAENEALRRRIAELETSAAGEKRDPLPPMIFKSKRQK